MQFKTSPKNHPVLEFIVADKISHNLYTSLILIVYLKISESYMNHYSLFTRRK